MLRIVIVLFAASVQCNSTPCRAEHPSSEDIESAYIYNFGKFVRWPNSARQGPVTLCVAAANPIERALARMAAGEQVDGRPLVVKALDDPQPSQTCSILFVSAAEHARTVAYLRATDGKPVLTVGDDPEFLTLGGIIQFVFENEHVRFAVNLNAARRNGLGLSSELLKVAINVIGNPEAGGGK